MSTPQAAPSPVQGQPGMSQANRATVLASMTPQKIQQIMQRVNALRANGHSEQTSPELNQLMQIIKMITQHKAASQRQQQQAQNPGSPAPAASPAQTNGTAPSPATPAPVAMTPPQTAQLRTQLHAYQMLNRNQPVPPFLQQAVQGNQPPSVGSQAPEGPHQKLAERTIESVMVDKAPADAQTPEAYALEYDPESIIYPYNAYTSPSFYLERQPKPDDAYMHSKFQRLIIPNLTPKGLDPYLLLEERNRFIQTRIDWRLKELEAMDPAAGASSGTTPIPNLVDTKPSTSMGVKARIELMQLRLLEKQKLLREDVVRAMHSASQIPADRSQFRRFRTHALRDARATENAERKQRNDRELKGKRRHLAYIEGICQHGRDLLAHGETNPRGVTTDRVKRLGRSVMKLHADTEKEEQKRIERLSKERLRALKADDEEGYLKLIDEAKDTRITHLLKQTDAFLDSLAAAVVEQQNDDVHRDFQPVAFESEDGPASEATFGAKRADGEEEGAEAKEGKVDYYAVAHRVQEKITKQASILTGGTLKDYQIKGLQWMISLYNNRLNGILADEMGLGKTIQTLSLITFLIETKRQNGPFLVIVPLSTLTNWTLEFERWAPTVRTVILKGSPAQRKEIYPRLRMVDFQVCLTTYEYIIKERPLLAKIKWVHMIIDEGHRMKNVKSKLSQTLNDYYSSRYRLILTGTPLQNNLPELWALLNFVLPKIFNSVKTFDEWFNTPFANTGTGEKMEMTEEEALLVIRRLHKVLRPFLLRRLKKDVESELPDKVEKVIKCKMSGLQWKLYKVMKEHNVLITDDTNVQRNAKANNLQNTLIQLRKICNHPFVFENVFADFCPLNQTDDLIYRSAGKFELLDRMLPKLFATGHRCLIFFQWTAVMDVMEDFMNYRGWRYCRLDGHTKADERNELLTHFNDANSPFQCFLLSTRAGGLGLNLQSADTVIIYDSDYNPHADLQAQDRAHRIGQKKEVRVFRLVSSATVEENILATAQGKLAIDGKVIQAGKFDNKSTAEERENFLRSLLEVNEEDNEESGELDDDELNDVLARGDHELAKFAEMDKERVAADAQHWAETGHKGPPPERLMTDAELPKSYHRNMAPVTTFIDEAETGRGRRAKNEVRYDDGLTEEQFINALENSDDDVTDAAERKRIRAENVRRRQAENMANENQDSPAPKRKRIGPSASVTPSVNEEDEEFPQKRRKTGTATGTATPAAGGKALMDSLYKAVNELVDPETGSKRNLYFVKPVSKTDYPDYYQLIQRPICMQQIRRNINGNKYKDVAAFRADMILLWDNARQYNVDGSWVHSQAEAMQAAFEDMYENEVGRASAGTPNEPQMKLKLKLAGASRPKPAKKQSSPPSSDDSEDDDY